jgi:hypothetical protein
VGATRRIGWMIAVCVAAVLAVLAVMSATSAGAQQDDAEDAATTEEPPAPNADALVERLDALEPDLPTAVVPTGVSLDDDTTWGDIQGDAGSTEVVLDTLEPDLRQLFIDADDAEGETADAVALVARGWLDIWQGSGALAEWETADLAFPIDATDDDDVATGADERYGEAERGLTMILEGQQRLLAGYTALRDLEAALPDVAAQDRFDARAADMELYDADIRPLVVRLISQPTTNVLVATERFETSAPGVDARAKSLEAICVDREALEELGGTINEVNAEEILARSPERADCPDLPAENDVTLQP